MTATALGLGAILILGLAGRVPECRGADPADPAALDHFERHVRPLLVERCQGCHGAGKQFAGLRLDGPAAIAAGGDSGPALVPGRPAESSLVARVRHGDEEVRMPPPEAGPRLDAAAIGHLEAWIAAGAPWPDAPPDPSDRAARERDHWAFQPLPPAAADAADPAAIDRLVDARLAEAGLERAPPADPRTLVRRVTHDLPGLPPQPEEVEAFLADASPDAYERLVDRLLASPRHAEHQARLWLDVARYSDTKGYVYGREERFFVHAPVYRDWVVDAVSRDLPFDRFVTLQLAADRLVPEGDRDLAALGFLTTGRRFLGVTPDIVDDRIDVVSRGLLGLTIGCARCHDHKYDPVATADYYGLYGVFTSSYEKLVPVARRAGAAEPAPDFVAELEKRRRALAEASLRLRAENSDRFRARIADYLFAQSELERYPELGFDQIIAKDDLIANIVRRWQAYLSPDRAASDPVFAILVALLPLPADGFPGTAAERIAALRASGIALDPRVAAAFETPPAGFRDVADRYGKIFAEIDGAWRRACQQAVSASAAPPAALPDPADERLRQVLYGPESPCTIPDEPIANIETLMDSDSINQIWKVQNELDQWLIPQPLSAPQALVLLDRAAPQDAQVFRRGNPANKGPHVPRRLPAAATGGDRGRFHDGSGRLELAAQIVAPDNPLATRVWVNRVWRQHFGRGLVETPSDFGLRADPPSHPELLDTLAAGFLADGRSTRRLHRRIVLSGAYRQQSVPAEAAVRRGMEADPDSRLLWRFRARRLEWEAFRDSLLAVAGDLGTDAPGGRGDDLLPPGPGPHRRSVYCLVDRQYVPGVMNAFDFANPDLHVPKRLETTVPQQALFALNHPFVAERARSLVRRAWPEPGADPAAIERVWRAVFQRPPSSAEREGAIAFVAGAPEPAPPPPVPAEEGKPAPPSPPPPLSPRDQLVQALLLSNEFLFVD
ncbi:MAG: DUF1553 domain-containing protein [Planctomycetaceae bacterium]